MRNLTFLLGFIAICYVTAIPIDSTSESLVAITSEKLPQTDGEKEILPEDMVTEPKITDMYIHSNVSNRFATTIIRSNVKNFAKSAKETSFFVIIPDKAFISEFIMEIDGVNYTAYVQEKEKARETYQKALTRGYAAAHISARNSNKFVVDVNIEPENKCVFYLKYEELLERNDGKYELKININPKQLVKNMLVEVDINENRAITALATPHIQSGNEITKESENLKSQAKISKADPTTAKVMFSPTIEKQNQIAQGLGVDEKEGISGQFIVQYDVERDPNGGEVLINDGHFVHFFAPSDVTQLDKHVVFVLDTSGSMYSKKMNQMKNAMRSILKDLRSNDFFSLVEFNTNVKVWNLNAPSESTYFPNPSDRWYHSIDVFPLEHVSFPPAYPVTNNTITKALNAVSEFSPRGGTNIYEAVRVGIHLIKLRNERNGKTVQPLIFFLTDGDATVGKTNNDVIVSEISELNIFKIPIISLSFGDGADRKFLEQLSIHNLGFARHIYLDSDASLQLENFYHEVSSPLLREVKFEYTPEVTSLTKVEFPVYFRGSEFVVAGKLPEEDFKGAPVISCIGVIGPTRLYPTVTKSVGQLERLWAYMTIQKFLDVKKVNETLGAQFDKKALDLAIKYSFVTPVTSLVVVKPNDTNLADAEIAEGSSQKFEASHTMSLSHRPVKLQGHSIPQSIPQFSGRSYSMPTSVMRMSGFSDSSKLLAGSPSYNNKRIISGGRPRMRVTHHFRPEQSSDEVDMPAMTKASKIDMALETNLPDDLNPGLLWLQSHLKWNGILDFLAGPFKLGFNANVTEENECITPDSKEGVCRLLKDCPELHTKIPDVQTFKDYFCSLKAYAGVCCSTIKASD